MDDAPRDSWQWMQRLTQALSLLAFAVIVVIGSPAAGVGADPARHHAAFQAYQAGRWADAWPALGALADQGDVEAARLASLMARQGPRLFGRAFEASPERQQAWARLAGVERSPADLSPATSVPLQALADR